MSLPIGNLILLSLSVSAFSNPHSRKLFGLLASAVTSLYLLQRAVMLFRTRFFTTRVSTLWKKQPSVHSLLAASTSDIKSMMGPLADYFTSVSTAVKEHFTDDAEVSPMWNSMTWQEITSTVVGAAKYRDAR
jgi:hypothetical protein